MINKKTNEEKNIDKEKVDFEHDRFISDISKIKAIHESERESFLETKRSRDNTDFNCRVGDIVMKESGAKRAIRIDRFSGASWGEIT